jgi:histidine triad (HIT) family protein
MDCLFCKLINREFPVTPLFENDDYIVLDDLHPKAPIHMLLIPKKHIETISDIDDADDKLI